MACQASAQRWQKLDKALSNVKKNQAKAFRLVDEKGWVKIDTSSGRMVVLTGVNKNGSPLYNVTYNLHSSNTIGNDKITESGSMGLDLTGEGVNIGLWDGGIPFVSHQEFNGRVKKGEDFWDAEHPTHVSGTMIAKGVNSKAKGMATNATIKAYVMDEDFVEMEDEARKGMILSNHSYGSNGGWEHFNYEDEQGEIVHSWLWAGDPDISDREDYKFGYYDNNSSVWDAIAYEYPNYLMVKAAGNSRGFGDQAETGNFFYNVKGKLTKAKEGQEPFTVNGPYDCIPTHSIAKNILTVGATEKVDFYSGPNSVKSAYFSSWGPADDGRIKPDIVAEGVDVFSCINQGYEAYGLQSGTSMSSPAVTGSIALLQDHYKDIYGTYMLSSMCKAVVIHSAKECGDYPGPDYMFGWGLLDTEAAVKSINKENGDLIQIDITEETEFVISSRGDMPLRITAAWTDPSHKGLKEKMDDRTPVLINDIDIRVTDEDGKEYFPWILDYNTPSGAATQGDNKVDNVEQILIDSPKAGNYKVSISFKKSLKNDSQKVSMVVSGTINNSELKAPSEVNVENLELNKSVNASYIIKNVGSDKIQIKSIVGSSQIKILSDLKELNKDTQSEINFTLTPNTIGYIDELITITYNSGKIKTTRISGFVKQFYLTYNETINFGDVEFRYTDNQVLKIGVVGNQDLVVTDVILPDYFTIDNKNFVVKGGQEIRLNLEYKPRIGQTVNEPIILIVDGEKMPISTIKASCSDGPDEEPRDKWKNRDNKLNAVAKSTVSDPKGYYLGVDQIDGISSMCISKDKKYVAFGGRSSFNLLVKDYQTDKVLKLFKREGRIESAIFTEDYLIVADYTSKEIRFYNIGSWTLKKVTRLKGMPMEIVAKGNVAYISTLDAGCYKLDLKTLKSIHIEELIASKGAYVPQLSLHNIKTFPKSTLSVSEDGRYAASALDSLRVYDDQIGEVHTYKIINNYPYGGIYKINIVDNNKLIFYAESITEPTKIGLINLDTKELLINYSSTGENKIRIAGQHKHLYLNQQKDKIILPAVGNKIYTFKLDDLSIESIDVYDYTIHGEYATIIYNSIDTDDYVYYSDAYGYVVRISKKNAHDIDYIYTDKFKTVKLISDNNQITGYDLNSEQVLTFDFDKKTCSHKRILENDCDGPVCVKLNSDSTKIITLFDLSQNIHISDLNEDGFKNPVVINLNEQVDLNSRFFDFEISSDDKFMFIAGCGNDQIYTVDLTTNKIVKTKTGGVCGKLTLNKKGSALYVAVDKNIEQYSVVNGVLSLTRSYPNTNAANILDYSNKNHRFSNMIVSNDGKNLFYMNSVSKQFVKLNVTTGKEVKFSTFFRSDDFVMNTTQDTVLISGSDGKIVIASIKGSEINKTHRVNLDETAKFSDMRYSKEENLFYLTGTTCFAINPKTGEVKSDKNYGNYQSAVYWKGDDTMYTGEVSFNGLEIPEYWTMNYMDDDQKEQKIHLYQNPVNWVLNPHTNQPIFICATPDSYLEFDKKVKEPIEPTLKPIEFKDFLLHPNPTNGIINLNFEIEKEGMIKIYSLTGRLIYEKKVEKSLKHTINISEQPNGIYILQFDSPKNKFSSKIIINK